MKKVRATVQRGRSSSGGLRRPAKRQVDSVDPAVAEFVALGVDPEKARRLVRRGRKLEARRQSPEARVREAMNLAQAFIRARGAA